MKNYFFALLLLLLVSCSAAQAESVKFPVHKSLGFPNISLDIYMTSVGGPGKKNPAWCYKTAGLSNYKQPEVLLTVLMNEGEADEAYPTAPVGVLRAIATNVKRGESVKAGQISDFQGKSFLAEGMVGLLLVSADYLPGVPDSKSCLSGVSIFQNEIDAADLAGSSRLIGALAKQSKYYPCPAWCDRNRKPVFTKDNLEEMKKDPLIAGARQVHSQASLVVSNKRAYFQVTDQSAQGIAKVMEAGTDAGLRIALSVDPRGNAFMTWTPGGEAPVAVTPPNSDGSRMSVQFLAIVPEQKKDECVRFGDGYSLLISSESWNKLVDALKKRKKYSLPLSGSEVKDFLLECKQPIVVSHASRVKTVSANSGSADKQKESKVEAENGQVQVKGLALLTSDDEIKAAMDPDALINYIQELKPIALSQLAAVHTKVEQEVMLMCELAPSKAAKYTVAVRPGVEGIGPIIKNFYAALSKANAPSVRGNVKFQFLIGIDPH